MKISENVSTIQHEVRCSRDSSGNQSGQAVNQVAEIREANNKDSAALSSTLSLVNTQLEIIKSESQARLDSLEFKSMANLAEVKKDIKALYHAIYHPLCSSASEATDVRLEPSSGACPVSALDESSTLEQNAMFSIQVDRTNGDLLGMLIHSPDNEKVVVQSIQDGLIRLYNNTHPARSVQPSDEIVEVDGKNGNPGELLEMLNANKVLSILVRRSV